MNKNSLKAATTQALILAFTISKKMVYTKETLHKHVYCITGKCITEKELENACVQLAKRFGEKETGLRFINKKYEVFVYVSSDDTILKNLQPELLPAKKYI